MVRANQLTKKNPYKKTSKTSKNQVDKNILPKIINKELKKGKNNYNRISKNDVNRKSIDDIDKNDSELKNTNIKNKLALISPIEITEKINIIKKNCKRNIIFENKDDVQLKQTDDNDKEIINLKNKQNEDDNDDSDDGFHFISTTNNTNESILAANSYKEKSTKESFDSDIISQGKNNIVGTVVRPVPNIKEHGKKFFPARLYVISTKANIWLAFSFIYRNIDKCPFSE